jgi:hypothetical protein
MVYCLRVMAVQQSCICARNHRPLPPPPRNRLTAALGMNQQISRTSGYSSVTFGNIRRSRIREGEHFTLMFQIPSFLLSDLTLRSALVQYETKGVPLQNVVFETPKKGICFNNGHWHRVWITRHWSRMATNSCCHKIHSSSYKFFLLEPSHSARCDRSQLQLLT